MKEGSTEWVNEAVSDWGREELCEWTGCCVRARECFRPQGTLQLFTCWPIPSVNFVILVVLVVQELWRAQLNTTEFSDAGIASNYILEDSNANSANICHGRAHFLNVCPPPPPPFIVNCFNIFFYQKRNFFFFFCCLFFNSFILFWNETLHVSAGTYSKRHLFVCCMYSLELLMMDGKTVRNM